MYHGSEWYIIKSNILINHNTRIANMAITDRTIELLVDVPVHAVQAELSQA
jgi:hypothetical protein